MNTTRMPLTLSRLLFAFALSAGLHAADGRIPIATVPFSINQPGHYYVTQDLALATAGSTMIGVYANNVTLDLGGHTLTQSGTGTTYLINASATYHFEVGNGHLIGGTYGVYVSAGTGSLRNFRVHDLLIDFSGGPIAFSATSGQFNNVVIERCRIWVNGAPQITLRNVNNGAVLDNTLYNASTSYYGVDATGTNLEIAGNRIFGGSGIAMTAGSGAAIHDNVIRGIAGVSTGISLAGVTASVIENNRISAASVTGINLSGNANNNILRGNDIANSLTGLAISGSTGNIYSGTRTPGCTTAYSIAASNTNGGDNQ